MTAIKEGRSVDKELRPMGGPDTDHTDSTYYCPGWSRGRGHTTRDRLVFGAGPVPLCPKCARLERRIPEEYR